MLVNLKTVAVSATIALGASSAGAATFTTETGTFNFLNFFEFGLPSNLNEFSFSGAVASSDGLPGLIGRVVSFDILTTAFASLALDPDGEVFDGTFSLGTFGGSVSEFVAMPDVATFADTPGGDFEFTFDPPFDVIGPIVGDLPEFPLYATYEFDGPLPTKTGFLYCDSAGGTFDSCDFLSMDDPDSTGFASPILVDTFTYVEGSVNGRVIFSTDPDPVTAAVPLPAAGWLMLAGLGVLGLRRRS